MFDNFNVNFLKNKGLLTSIPCIPILEYGWSNAPLNKVPFLSFPFFFLSAGTRRVLTTLVVGQTAFSFPDHEIPVFDYKTAKSQ